MLDKLDQYMKGIGALFFAYFIWGAMPIYWKALQAIPSSEILGHRVVWSVIFTFILTIVNKNRKIFIEMFRESKRDVFWLAVGGFLISFNWGLFIWAVIHGKVLETSLGYFINPLLSMFLGMMFFKEKLNKTQTAALCLAVIGVSVELIAVGSVPVVSLSLALSFGLYGVIKKVIKARPEIALFIETLTLTPFALAWLVYLQKEGAASFPYEYTINFLLAGSGIMTSIPLLLFAYGAARVPLTTIGFAQYTTPTLSFAIGVFIFNEVIEPYRILTFIFIWAALALYSAEAIFRNRQRFDKA